MFLFQIANFSYLLKMFQSHCRVHLACLKVGLAYVLTISEEKQLSSSMMHFATQYILPWQL